MYLFFFFPKIITIIKSHTQSIFAIIASQLLTLFARYRAILHKVKPMLFSNFSLINKTWQIQNVLTPNDVTTHLISKYNRVFKHTRVSILVNCVVNIQRLCINDSLKRVFYVICSIEIHLASNQQGDYVYNSKYYFQIYLEFYIFVQIYLHNTRQ